MKKITLIFTIFLLYTSATQGAAALKGQSYEEAVTFSEREYQAYMDRIERLNPEIHAKLKDYKDLFHEPAFLKAADLKPTVLIPTQKSHGQPMMVLPTLTSDKELERYLASYKALTRKFIPGKYDFSDAEYQHYMKLINEIDPTMYQNLRKYEWKTGERNLSNALDREEEVIFPENLISNTYYVNIKSIPNQTEDEQREHLRDLFEKAAAKYGAGLAEYYSSSDDDDDIKGLTDILEKFNKDASTHDLPLFPKDKYHEYMEIIKELDESVYKDLIACEKELGKPCLRPGKNFEIIPLNDGTHGYPIILLGQDFKEHSAQETYLKRVIQAYKQAYALTEERTKVLRIIKDFAPELYTELVAVDPTGKNHIRRGHTAITTITHDRFPLFTVSYSHTMELPEDQLRFILGHELSHYVQDVHDILNSVSPTHKAMKGNETLPQEYARGRKKISGQLPFEETFNKARIRTKEYGADAGSVMHFKTNIDAAIAWLQNQTMRREEEYKIAKQPLPTTFTTTHPLPKDRIAHLRSLRPEVERRKASGQKPAPIDWKALMEKYKNRNREAW